MNERIKKLAEQSGFYFYDLHDVDGEDLGETIEADSWTAAEKFAELIVKECISVMEITDITDFKGVELALKIKQHFGVE